MNKNIFPQISLVIPTYMRPDHLGRLLDSLSVQSVEKDCFEVFVVDNANDEDMNKKIQRICSTPKYGLLQLHYIHHPLTGVCSTRNRGAEAAHADLVAFLDDDVYLKKDWIERALQDFKINNPDIVGGPYKPYFMEKKPYWFHDDYLKVSYGNQARWLLVNETIVGGNMICKKSVFDNLGGFSTTYGSVGNKHIYGEDTEFNLRAYRAGYTVWFDPNLEVNHYAYKARMRIPYYIRMARNNGKVKCLLYFHEWFDLDSRPKGRRILSQMKYLVITFISLIGKVLRLPFRSHARYKYWQNYVIEVILPELQRLYLSFGLIKMHLFTTRGNT